MGTANGNSYTAFNGLHDQSILILNKKTLCAILFSVLAVNEDILNCFNYKFESHKVSSYEEVFSKLLDFELLSLNIQRGT